MPRPYSVDLRERILNDHDAGSPVEDLAAQYTVSRSWIYTLLQQRRETGSIARRSSCVSDTAMFVSTVQAFDFGDGGDIGRKPEKNDGPSGLKCPVLSVDQAHF